MENYSVLKGKKIRTHVTVSVNHEDNILREISQIEKDKYMIPLI